MAKSDTFPFRHLTLPAQALDLPGLGNYLGGVACSDGRVRLFLGVGTAAAAILPAGFEEAREVSGGLMLVTLGRAGPFRLSLAGGGAVVLDVGPPQTLGFAGRNVMLIARVEESAAQVAEGLIYHARHHGANAALVINRVPGDDPTDFAMALDAAVGGGLAVTVLDIPVPTGKRDTGPETHPYLAPDAPGKDRMEVPAPDPWRAPLGEGVLYEALKWLYLSDARAVVQLEAIDLLVPLSSGAPSVFDRAVAEGVVPLTGTRIYPWRVRDADETRFGDHICRQFDATRGSARWAVAPIKAGLKNTWRQTRIAHAGAKAIPAPFLRAMALRVGGRSSAELAPKTSLIVDADLLALSQGTFRHKPVRPPASKPSKPRGPASGAGRTAIVTTMKNEGPFILEWIAYHRVIGVDDFLVYTNDCTDGTDSMLHMMQTKGLCQWRENPFKDTGLKPQHAALQAAESEPMMRDCAWGICMDVDEFIDIKIGDGTLAALYAAMGEANMISLTWRLFGNAEVHAYADDLLIRQFTRCAPEVIRKPHQAWGFKTLFRNIDIYKKLGVHRPKGLKPDLWQDVAWLNGSGQPLPKEMFRNGWRSTLDTYGYDWVQLNHYAVRSAESFLVKRDRGRVNHVDRDQGLNYWFRMNHNLEHETSIQRMIPQVEAEMARLLADPDIAAAHAHSVACHRAKITELMQTESYQRFYGELTGSRMEKLCRMQQHFGSAVFAAGPGVIPPDLHEADHAPDFFFTVEFDGEAEH